MKNTDPNVRDKKRKVGRPKLPASERRSVVTLRLSQQERGSFESSAKAKGLPLSTWIRQVLKRAVEP